MLALIGHFTEKYHDAVIAAGTVFIAIFTFTLWRSTNRLWEAGEKQIRVSDKAAADCWRSDEGSTQAEQSASREDHLRGMSSAKYSVPSGAM